MNWFRKWWGDDKPTSFFSHFERPYRCGHWSAKLLRTGTKFIVREWKWIIGVTIAIVGVVLKNHTL